MLSTFPSPNQTKGIDYSWDQLVLGINSLNSYRDIIEDFWRIIVPVLDEVKNVEIQDPEEEAWFHLRRTAHPNQQQAVSQYAQGRIEILRLKREFIPQDIQEEIRLLLGKYGDVICVGWWPLNFTGSNDNAFLSFLQKLSILRGRDRIFYNDYLAKISNGYDRCPHCQEAYRVMMTHDSSWTEALTPWFAYMASTNMEPYRTHEYAHWFGHILSGWP